MQTIDIDQKNIKTYLLIGLFAFFVLIVAISIITRKQPDNAVPAWAQSAPQDIENIQDIKIAVPIVTDTFTIDYVESGDFFTVEYAGYLSKDEIEAAVVSWMKTNTDMTNVNIKYPQASKEVFSYDLTKDLTEVLKDNEIVNPTDAPKGEFGRS